mmetsp:Transcript_21102/g.53313  ORF Transcript_21102/g.53313 Transcript_21102/m.53313 type:complete len:194 (+) Transcript_21102:359-940(+)
MNSERSEGQRRAASARLAALAERKADERIAEWLLKNVRKAELDARQRLGAALALARMIASHGEDASRSVALELEAAVGGARYLLAEFPSRALELAEVCEWAPELLRTLADLVWEELEQDALSSPASRVCAEYRYILVDLMRRQPSSFGRWRTPSAGPRVTRAPSADACVGASTLSRPYPMMNFACVRSVLCWM